MATEEDPEPTPRRVDAADRHPTPLTEDRVRRIIYDGDPAPAGVDPETVAAVRRIARHLDKHGRA